MRTLPFILAALLAACGAPELPVSSAPRPATRVGSHDTFESVLLSTSSRVIPTRDRVSGTPDALWPSLARAYGDLGLAIAYVDTAARVLGNPSMAVRRELAGERLSNFIDCGRTATGVPLTDSYNVTVQVYSQLRPAAEGTEVRTLVTGRALNPTTNDPPVDCSSTGRLEKRIVTGLMLSGAAAPGAGASPAT